MDSFSGPGTVFSALREVTIFQVLEVPEVLFGRTEVFSGGGEQEGNSFGYVGKTRIADLP